MAASQASREKRPWATRASPSARDDKITNGEFEVEALSSEIPAAERIFSSSPVPTTASTSGIFFWISSRKRSTRQPATTSFCARPSVLSRAISRIVSTDSCCALPINEQVLTTMTSASSAREVNSAPAWVSKPIMTSLSTRFLGQPKLTNPTLRREALLESVFSRCSAGTDFSSATMEFYYSTIHKNVRLALRRRFGVHHGRQHLSFRESSWTC